MKAKRLITLLAAVLIALTIVPIAGFAASSNELIPLMTDNVHSNNYISNERWADTTKSYFYYEDGYYIRAEDYEGKLVIEKYDSNFVLKSSKSIDNELPLFGGCFIGSKYNFLIVGQENNEEDDSKEIIRVIRFTKNWDRVDECSIKGNNTIKPFNAGNLRAVEHDGKLYVRTCHTMYKYLDGVNHQANLTFVVDCNSMDLLFIYSEIMNNHVGYASHSFNQFFDIDKDTGNIIAVDHGDASPRSVILFEYEPSFSSMTSSDAKTFYNTDFSLILPIQGNLGNNTTGVMVGGLKISEKNYLTVLASVLQDDTWSKNKIRDIYVIATSKTDKSIKKINLTNYDKSKTTTANNPFIIDIGNGKYMVMWESKTIPDTDYLTNYVIIDENGNKLTDIKTANANLSDCEPIVLGNNVMWYVSDKDALDFYSVDKDTLKLSKTSQPYAAAPTTAAPTTAAPTTAAPTTAAPTTAAPTTAAPTTAAPTTAAPTTAAPVTDDPVTDDPVTAAPTTDASTEEGTTASVYIPGDLTRDGIVTASDARLALRMSAALVIPTEEDKIIADINGDNKLTAADARAILRISAKL